MIERIDQFLVEDLGVQESLAREVEAYMLDHEERALARMTKHPWVFTRKWQRGDIAHYARVMSHWLSHSHTVPVTRYEVVRDDATTDARLRKPSFDIDFLFNADTQQGFVRTKNASRGYDIPIDLSVIAALPDRHMQPVTIGTKNLWSLPLSAGETIYAHNDRRIVALPNERCEELDEYGKVVADTSTAEFTEAARVLYEAGRLEADGQAVQGATNILTHQFPWDLQGAQRLFRHYQQKRKIAYAYTFSLLIDLVHFGRSGSISDSNDRNAALLDTVSDVHSYLSFGAPYVADAGASIVREFINPLFRSVDDRTALSTVSAAYMLLRGDHDAYSLLEGELGKEEAAAIDAAADWYVDSELWTDRADMYSTLDLSGNELYVLLSEQQ